MISVAKAYKIVLEHALLSTSEEIPLLESIGRVLAKDVMADRDFPPFDRVTMDGIAINYKSYADGQSLFFIEGVAAAGSPQLSLKDPNNCIEVMTGASLPKGTDTVIRYEDLKREGNSYALLVPALADKNIHYRAGDLKQGERLLKAGTLIKAIDVNNLATVGCALVPVYKLPKVAVISSGDELVEVDQFPEDYQIRKSNVFMLLARLKELGIQASAFHLTDSKSKITEQIAKLDLQYDVLLLSGGVSKGKFDFIPEVLSELGFDKHFHRVAQRPGKPFWFGTKKGTTVFAFPGNPISTLSCFHKYFISWLSLTQGKELKQLKVILDEDYHFKPDLTRFAQASLRQSVEGIYYARIIKSNGSGDLVSPLAAEGFVELPNGKELYKKGERFDFIPFYPIFR